MDKLTTIVWIFAAYGLLSFIEGAIVGTVTGTIKGVRKILEDKYDFKAYMAGKHKKDGKPEIKGFRQD